MSELKPELFKLANAFFARSGHGHVFARTDGVRARCGGPYLCGSCAAEKIIKDAWQYLHEVPPPLTEDNANG